MASTGTFGLLKFFRNETYLDAFINGIVHFSTPETFRRCKQEGVGDDDESASATFRRDRGDEDVWEIQVDNDDGTWTTIPGVESITIRNTGHSDRWLHCWMELRIDESDEGLERLGADLENVLAHFGSHYVFLPGKHVEDFMKRIRKSMPHADIGLFKVKYSDRPHLLGPYCKRSRYAYQREVRIMLDECDDHEIQPRQIKVEEGFYDIVEKKPGLRISKDGPLGRTLTLTPKGKVEWSNNRNGE